MYPVFFFESKYQIQSKLGVGEKMYSGPGSVIRVLEQAQEYAKDASGQLPVFVKKEPPPPQKASK